MPRFNITNASPARVNQKFRFETRSFSACLRANSALPASVFCNSCTVLAFPPFTPAPCVVTPPTAACASVQSENTKGNFECLESQCAIADFSLGAACPHVGHLYLACPAAPPNRSCFPAAPPPRFVSAASALAASDFAVCFFGFAFPAMTTNEPAPSVDGSVQSASVAGVDCRGAAAVGASVSRDVSFVFNALFL